MKNDTILGLPVNRFVTWVKPLLNQVAGLFAAWLVAKVNIVGVLGLTEDTLATQISAGLGYVLTTGLLTIADLYWIKGHHIELENGGLVLTDDEQALIGDDVRGLPIDASAGVDQGDAGRP